MARLGVTFNEVAEAASLLVGQGKNPTIEQVRLILGTGSSTTIANHLRQWKEAEAKTCLLAVKENLPEELVGLMKGLWERVIDQSHEKIRQVEAAYEQTIAQLQQDLTKYKNNNRRWQQLFYHWMKEKEELVNSNQALHRANELLQKDNTILYAKQDALIDQLQERQDRINEVMHLHAQTQAHLDEYREAVRHERKQDHDQHHQEKKELQNQIQKLNEQFSQTREQTASLELDYRDIQNNFAKLEQDCQKLTAKLEQSRTTLTDAEKLKNEYAHSAHHWQEQYKYTLQTLEQKTDEWIESKAEAKALRQHLAQAQLDLKAAAEQNNLLDKEKWMLAQEKSHLEGQLQQMQKILPT